jgi:hypothetical protein
MAEMIDINLEDVDAWGEQMAETPACKLYIKEATWKHKEGAQYPYIGLVINPRDGKHDNMSLYLNVSTSPNSHGHLKALFVATRMPAMRIRANDPEVTQMLVGREFRGNVTKGEQRNEIKTPYHVA